MKNVYRGGMSEFLLDIFNRVYIVHDDYLVPTEYFTQCDIEKREDTYRIRTIDNKLIILDKDYTLLDFIPDAEVVTWAAGAIIFRRAGKCMLYAPNKGEIVIDCVVPHEKIKSLAITLTSDDVNDYQIHGILDLDGRLIIGHKIIAHDVSSFGYTNDYIVYMTKTDNAFHYRRDGKTIEIAKDVSQYKITIDSPTSDKIFINCLTKSGDLYQWREGVTKVLDRNVSRTFLFHSRCFWYNKSTFNIEGTQGRLSAVIKPVPTICDMKLVSPSNSFRCLYNVIGHKSLLTPKVQPQESSK